MPEIPVGSAITEFSGLRAASSTGDFVLGKSMVPGLLQAAGIQSPGLTSAPAIAKYLVEVLKEELKQYFKISEITPLSTFFDEEWFSQDKQLVYVPA